MPTTATSKPTPQPKRTARVRLSPERIVNAGLEIAAQPGVTTVSVRVLGTHLGTDPTAIYRHFRNKEELMQALLDELNVRSVGQVTAPPEDWKARLRQISEATLDEYTRHPAIATESVVLTTHGPGELNVIELMLDAFTVAGLSDEEVVRHYALLSSHVLSMSAGIAQNTDARTPAEPDTYAWFDGPVVADARTHPRIARFGQQIAELRYLDLFHLGVESVIESAERTAAR